MSYACLRQIILGVEDYYYYSTRRQHSLCLLLPLESGGRINYNHWFPMRFSSGGPPSSCTERHVNRTWDYLFRPPVRLLNCVLYKNHSQSMLCGLIEGFRDTHTGGRKEEPGDKGAAKKSSDLLDEIAVEGVLWYEITLLMERNLHSSGS